MSDRWIFVSPHLDDTILSCGGFIEQLARTRPVEIWTVFCSAPFLGPYSLVASWLHQISGGKRGAHLALIRRKEDRKACRILGAGFRHFRWHDAVYRKSKKGSFLYLDCHQSHWAQEDEVLIRAVSQKISRLLRPNDRLVVPMAIGGHVDHKVSKEASERTMHPATLYYPDVPYVQRFSGELTSLSRDKVQLRYSLDNHSISAWVDSVQAYSSQRKMLEDVVGPAVGLINSFAEVVPNLFARSEEIADLVAAEFQPSSRAMNRAQAPS